MWFTRVSLNNPVLATMVMLALVVLGLFSIQRLQVDMFPNVDFPVVVVTTEYPGAAPSIVENEISKKIEESVNGIAGINALTSRSYQGTSVVIIEFGLHVDGRRAAEDVREKIAAVRPTLLADIKEPRVQRFDPATRPIWSVAVVPQKTTNQGDTVDLVELSNWVEKSLRKRLENVRGVGAINVVGQTQREINIYLRPKALQSYGISAEQVAQAVRNETQDLPAGSLRSSEQERVVQITAAMARPEDFRQIIVARRGNGTVKLHQVADVVDGAQDLDSLALYNGQRTLLVSVQKVQDDNTIAVVDRLNQTVLEMQKELPPGIRLETVQDGSRQIRVSVANVRQTLLEGAALTVLIVFLFLNSWRSTIITGLTLPIALISTFFFMDLMGFTINMITMMALSLCVGLLIDDAIVVRENIVRHAHMGKSTFDAALEGTQEIGLAVFATTMSIVAVFLPIGFMGGIVGKFFHEFGLTIVAAVLISMFVSFTLDPMLSSIWHDPSIHAEGRSRVSLYDRTLGRLTGLFDRLNDALADWYQGSLKWALRHKLLTLLLGAAVFVASLLMVPLLGTEFVPKSDYSETTITFSTPVGSSLEVTEQRAKEVESIIRSMPEVRYTLATINTGALPGKINTSVYVRLLNRDQRKRGVEEVAVALRQRLREVAGITVTHVGLLDPVGGQKQIQFSISGPDSGELSRLNTLALSELQSIPGLVDVDSSSKPNNPTVDIDIKREAASDLGLGVAQISNSLRTLLTGQTVGSWRAPDDSSYDVKVRLSPEARRSAQDLGELPLIIGAQADGKARVASLNQFATIRTGTGPNQINRRNLTREVAITANASGRAAGDISADIRRVMDNIQMSPGYSYQFSGSVKDMAEAFHYALMALLMAVIFIYMILASQFKSFLQPLALMTSLPLTLIGVVLALLLFNSTLSMFSVIGVVMLMGLVTKNAILLVDFAIRAREDGQSREQALLDAARVRLRPILMTTLAMVFGMLPLALALSEGSETRSPMGQAVIGGVITSSILTLVVVPVVYCYLDDLSQFLKKVWRKPQASGFEK